MAGERQRQRFVNRRFAEAALSERSRAEYEQAPAALADKRARQIELIVRQLRAIHVREHDDVVLKERVGLLRKAA